MNNNKIGLGGSCHWCTEAVFQSLRGVAQVEQGWIASSEEHNSFSEAVIVHFEPSQISLLTLIEVHLHTHSCTPEHFLRSKYRSAVYTFSEEQAEAARAALSQLQQDFEQKLITQVLTFKEFKLNKEQYLNYYKKKPEKPFCQNYIAPKLKILLEKFHTEVKL